MRLFEAMHICAFGWNPDEDDYSDYCEARDYLINHYPKLFEFLKKVHFI